STDRPVRTLLVTSAVPGEGKTTVASSLAIMLAGEGKRVILADLDLRRPGVHQQFKLDNYRGLTNLLVQDDALLGEYLLATPFPGLRVLPAGPLPPNPAELIASERMDALLATLAAEADMLVIDSSPVLAVTDPVILASRVDATLLVVNVERTHMRQLRTLSETISTAGGRVLGVALNRSQHDGTSGYYYYYYYQHKPSGNGNGHGPAEPLPAGTGTAIRTGEN
ncbi:MAG TPA: CpsD/CapB family tyrosine-protein kinase, partial [Chloroflexota bacterium]